MNNPANGLCDLHIHSTFSDSDADLESIFKQASEKKLRCIAITDHDTVSGLDSARSLSVQYGVELIDALELSAYHEDSEMHILGYFIDPANQALEANLAHLKELRRERLMLMADKLNHLGLAVDKDELFEKIGSTIPTRLHLALYLVEKKLVASFKEVFRKYLSPGRPAYQSRFKHSVGEAIAVIKSCGGLSVLAHPHIITNQAWIEDFIAMGLDGLEVVYPSMSEAKQSLYQNMCSKHNLLKTGGSDAHGSYKEFTQIGSVGVSYEWVQEMKDRLAAVRL